MSIYSDRHGIFKPVIDTQRPRLTQFGPALEALDIESIQAISPQAKSWVERVNRTLRDKLVNEMWLNGISTLVASNAFLHGLVERSNRKRRPYQQSSSIERDLSSRHTPFPIWRWWESWANRSPIFPCFQEKYREITTLH